MFLHLAHIYSRRKKVGSIITAPGWVSTCCYMPYNSLPAVVYAGIARTKVLRLGSAWCYGFATVVVVPVC